MGLKQLSTVQASYISLITMSCGLVIYWAFDVGKFSKDYFINTYSTYFAIDTTLIAMVIHIHLEDGHTDLFVFVMILLSITFFLSILKIYNGWKVYNDHEYLP